MASTMSISPPKPRPLASSLPSLRPGKSLAAPSPPKQTKIPPPRIPKWNFTTASAAEADKGAAPSAAPQHLTRASPNGPQPLPATSTTGHSSSLSVSRSADRYQKSPLSHRPSQHTSSTPDQPPEAPVLPPQTNSQIQDQTPPSDPPFFRLTQHEYGALRKKSHKPLGYRFSDFHVARRLMDLGRGWDGFIRARKKAEQEGRLERFQHQLQAEIDETARLGGKTLPVGAISMTFAEKAAGKKIRLSSASKEHKNRQPRKVKPSGSSHAPVDTQSMEIDKTKNLLDIQTGAQNSCPFPAGHSRELGEDPPAEEPQLPHQDHSEDCLPSVPAHRPRPRRVEKLPDYRIRTIDEAERETQPEASPVPRRRHSRSPSLSPRQTYESAQPKFTHFFCEWKGCRAVLNNLSILRNHVGVVHGPEARKKLRCRWGACGQFEEGDLAAPVAFATIEDLDHHAQSRHMVSLMWHMGDGRKGMGIVVDQSGHDDCPSYLFWNGKQVTPSVKDQKMETLEERRQRKERLRVFLASCGLAGGSEMDLESDCPDEDEDIPRSS